MTSPASLAESARPRRKGGGRLRNLGRRLADEGGSVGGEADDVGPRLIYEHNPKHRPVARQGPRGEISRAPRGDCQTMFECSILEKPHLRKGVAQERS
jgi:hypothetical protein